MEVKSYLKQVQLEDQLKAYEVNQDETSPAAVAVHSPRIVNSTEFLQVETATNTAVISSGASSGEVSFADMDVGADGSISQADWDALHPENGSGLYSVLLEKFDVDGDGVLNAEEFEAAQTMKSIRDSFSTDGDNFLSPEEMQAFQQFLSEQGIDDTQPVTLEEVETLAASM